MHYEEPASVGADLVVGSLLEAVPWIRGLERHTGEVTGEVQNA